VGAIAELDRAAAAAGFHVPMSDEYEQKLVERLKKRDEAAFTELIKLYQARVFRLVFRMLNDRAEAEELAHEVFITVFKSIHSFRGDSKLSTWLYRVATNHCKNRIKYLSRRARGQKKEFDEVADRDAIESATMSTSAQLPRPDEMAQARQAESFVKLALAELDDDQKELVILRHIENLTYEEIQEITGLPEGTVKSRLHRARFALKSRLAELQVGDLQHEENEP
jgi:RNA polymerase sigma-70 factor (ECF subfamily)